MAAQSIRPSQFITTFGPGSILEGPDGPRVIYNFARSNIFHNHPVSEFAIDDAGLSRIISILANATAQIVRLPTNADFNEPDATAIYETETFPKWSLCVTHNVLYRRRPANDNKKTGCPQCGDQPSSYHANLRARREAIRFIQACKNGHMDDVDWFGLFRHRIPGCRPQFLKWTGGGSSLREVQLECPACQDRVNLGDAYGRDLTCSGLYPERGELSAAKQHCNRSARMMQRGATFLYSPEHITAITIPNLDTSLHQLMAASQRLRLLQSLEELVGPGFDAGMVKKSLSPSRNPDPSAEAMFRQYDDAVILATAKDVLAHQFPETAGELLIHEFTQLQRAATHGHPSQPSVTPGAPPLFEVVHGDVRTDLTWPGIPLGLKFRVAPVSRVRVVMVLLGYRRMDNTPEPDRSQLVSVQHAVGADYWYPGVELFGEGVFIDLSPEPGQFSRRAHPEMRSTHANAWQAVFDSDTSRTQKHPVFAWWHTLAHRLIVALSVDSGYSSASIRERIYIRVNNDGTAAGGILLYTVQPGGDGTLGGLIALVPHFERVLQGALLRVDSCSNDPLCGEETYNLNRPNGAICYACGLVSETSCEHRNMHLDRNLLRFHPLA